MKTLKFKTKKQILRQQRLALSSTIICAIACISAITSSFFEGWFQSSDFILPCGILFLFATCSLWLYDGSNPINADQHNRMINDLVELNDAELSHQIASALSSSMVITRLNFGDIYQQIAFLKDRQRRQELMATLRKNLNSPKQEANT